MSLVLGIDAGTSGLRACITDDQGDVVTSVSTPLPASIVEGTRVEQQPLDWWDACCKVLDELFTLTPAGSIMALAIDGTSSTCLLCDDQGQPLGPALMYNDSRARSQATKLHKWAGSDAVLASSVGSPSSSLAKLMWLVENIELTDSTRFCHQSDWLTGHFLNRFEYSDENNALKLGYDAQSRRWPENLAGLELPVSILPAVKPAGSILGKVSKAMQLRFGLPAECLVVAGTTDSTASCLAAGISQPGDAVTVLGSTLVVKILSKKPVFAPEYGVYSHRLGDHWLVGGASNTGGAVLKHYFDIAQLQKLSDQIDPYSDSGLDYYPLLRAGERFPHNDPDYAPRLEPRPADDVDFLHGLLEGIARIEASAYKKLVELGAPAPTGIRSIGGGACNKNWQHMRAHLSGVPMIKANNQQTACGAARLALQSMKYE